MHSVKVKRSDLIAKLEVNRTHHREVFERALSVYRQRAIEELDKMIEAAKRGDQIRRSVGIPEPEEHTDDYDRVLSMLRMSVDEHIEIDSGQFQQYVMDQWGWARSFGTTTMSYTQ